MLFQSQLFVLLFLPACLLAFYLARRHVALRQWILVLFSLIFYGWWDVRFLPLLVGQISITWYLARISGPARTKWPLQLAVVVNLASIGLFKYLDFFLGNIAALLHMELPKAGLILPIGISFFSFQLVSYVIDFERGEAPDYSFRSFILFTSFFPQLIAGPIVRHHEIIPQLDSDPLREGWQERCATGAMIFTLGFAKKVLIADRLAPIVDRLFAQSAQGPLTFSEAWSAALGFTVQLFMDFAAYSEMAIGIGLMFALVLPENFSRPYLAVDLQDFWRRWHMTLSRFIRDYLYIPLGGSRHGAGRYVAATLLSMGLCGLWHGAGWTFVVWGLMHGIGLIVLRAWRGAGLAMPSPLSWLLTFLFVVAGWVIFRATDFSSAASILGSMTGANGFGGRFQAGGLIATGLLASVVIPAAHELRARWLVPHPAIALVTAALAFVCILEVGKGAPQSFIYFQF
ncbi:MAG: MBOAT family protein [Beijerinckiaceae bacterium]